jgi:hypothetical protein
MDPRFGLILAASVILASCDKGEDKPDGGDDKASAGDKDDTKDSGDEGKADSAGDEGGGGDDQPAAMGEYPDAIHECPAELSGRVEKDRVIGKDCGEVKVKGSVRVENASLILQAGAKLAFEDGADLMVGYAAPGKLIVEASKDDPVVMTSAGDKAPGVWKGVRLEGKSDRSSIDGLVIEYAGDKNGALSVKAADVTVKNSTIKNVKETAVVADANESRFAEFAGNKFESIEKVAMRVSPLAAGDIAADNEFPEGSEVHVKGTRLQESAAWQALSAPIVVIQEVRIEGADATRAWLDIEAGAHLMFDADGAFMVGYTAEGGMRIKGTEDKPVVLEARERKEAGAWRGLNIQSKGELEIEHATLEHAGKKDKEGAIFLAREARAKIENVAFTDDTVGVVIHGQADVTSFENNTFKGTETAIVTDPAALGSLGDGNTYEGDARIVINRGRSDDDMDVTLQKGAKFELDGEWRIEKGTVALPAGMVVHVKDGALIRVGYTDVASLKLEGTESEPIKFVGLRDEPGAWKGITLHTKAKGNVIEHVVLRDTGEPAGLQVERDSDGKIDHLTCEKCEGAALKRHKDAKVEVGEVKAAEGTASAEAQ